ncbi:LysR family transcriptional regulator [Klebsiella pneumoniae]|uniref:LysR family transcriptional regulator n=1 Tax=Klebsiella pneumoniae TaxID=573 RepID=A0A378AY88_KLEPN|nr:LysR family transcriptional regulator [Klebsiella pneumoniae]
MLANLEVKWLYDVIALEESRSFTLAAKARNISQSSFSRRIPVAGGFPRIQHLRS